MIKFKYFYQPGFIFSFKQNYVYKKSVANATAMFNKLSVSTPKEAKTYGPLFKSSFILSMVFCKPKDLKKRIKDIYDEYPVLADRFNPYWIFKHYNLDFSPVNLPLNSEANKAVLRNHKVYLLKELGKIVREKNSRLAQYYIDELNNTADVKEIRRLSIRVRNVCQGTSVFLKATERYYPVWFKNIESIFDYDFVRKTYGVDIIKASNLLICPYCNKREVESTFGKNSCATPDVDHFYPKSKYPFLAVTLSNFIPSCQYCNQRFKRDKDTFEHHLHPLIGGTRNYRVFKFFPQLDKLPMIKMSGCVRFKNNMEMFELESEYQKKSTLMKYKDIEDTFEMLKDIAGDAYKVIKNKKYMRLQFDIGDTNNALNTNLYKFKLDALSTLTKNSYKK